MLSRAKVKDLRRIGAGGRKDCSAYAAFGFFIVKREEKTACGSPAVSSCFFNNSSQKSIDLVSEYFFISFLDY
jgi:hypothetical protein